MTRSFGAFLSVLALCAQMALPLAHELRVAEQEADHPHASASAGPAWSAQPASSHHHHDADHCLVCPVVSRLGALTWARAVSFAYAAVSHSSLPARPECLPRLVDVRLAGSRAPPRA